MKKKPLPDRRATERDLPALLLAEERVIFAEGADMRDVWPLTVRGLVLVYSGERTGGRWQASLTPRGRRELARLRREAREREMARAPLFEKRRGG